MQLHSDATHEPPSFTLTIIIPILLSSIPLSLILIAIAIHSYRAFWTQHGALTFVLEPVCALLLYAAAILWIARSRQSWWTSVLRIAFPIGLAAAFVEILSILIEDSPLSRLPGPLLPLASMLTLFSLWGLAGWLGSRTLYTVRGGLATAISSAAVCMLFGVAGGFLMELFLAPPPPATVATWAEFKRSAWSDPHAFAIANTLDSGFTHLLLAPVIATIVGGLASLAGTWSAGPRAQGKLSS